jgi:type I restriction enzyme, S subunit
MIYNLKPYPKMKDSGVEWLGEVPEHWENRKLRTVLRSVSERNCPDLPLLSVVREKGVIVRDVSSQDENHNYIPDDLSNYKVVRIGQFAMNKMKAWQGSYGVSRFEGIVSPAYFVFDLNNVEGAFFNTAIRSKTYIPFFIQASDGVRIGQWDLSQARMREIPFALPPLPEQTAIVRYLDYMDRRIRSLIRTKRKLITLLNEQKQVIIHHAVTRGLDPNVPLKDSGVEWLGMVPEHWGILRLKKLIDGRLTYGANMAAEHKNREWPRYLRITDFSLTGKLKDETFRSLPPETAKDYLVKPGDLLFARSGATVGKCFLVPEDSGTACHAGYLIKARPKADAVNPVFLFLFTQSKGFNNWKNSTFIISTIQNISAEKYADLPVPTPPIHEQNIIVEHISRTTSTLDTTITRAQREIDLLTEYRTRLIADVVTGKVDVREAAARLPEVDLLAGVDEVAEGLDGVDEELLVDGDAVEMEAEP